MMLQLKVQEIFLDQKQKIKQLNKKAQRHQKSEKKKKVIINQQELVIFGVIIILNTKVMVIKIKHYQLKNILINLDHT